MKAKDLMIGDWVYNPFTRKKLRLTFGRDIDLAEELCLEPIPLTAEILEKNGFKWDELPKFAVNEITENTKMTFSYHLGSRTVFVGVNEPNFNLTSACVLYVHELQHILRQSRIEKEIIL